MATDDGPNADRRVGEDCHVLNHYYEACRLRAYPDPASPLFAALRRAGIDPYNLSGVPAGFAGVSGVPWTIGWGDTQDVRPGLVISQADADARYARRIVRDFEPAARAAVQVDLDQRQWDAVVSTVYNTGPGGRGRDGILFLADGRPSTFLRKLNAGDAQGAADELPKWVRAGGQVLKGLQRRRHATRLVFLGLPARDAIAAAELAFP
ncbi:lysozyme [Pseudacidovorax sp. RU35E]|uniref:lysozyme n=1 Tax=Pseudacidovorax sp. RU35E TaxID=1907403 RepID=UPI000953C8DC|nr:lysozyme [Pseudacidovorax sp. RU35E]SIQ99480.1 lysozyme [Pseudacidovorax sp. RU35E]